VSMIKFVGIPQGRGPFSVGSGDVAIVGATRGADGRKRSVAEGLS
jgi:hypothetical protein